MPVHSPRGACATARKAVQKPPLARILDGAGLEPQTLRLSEGGALVVLPSSGRVLGLFSTGSDENFLWTHSALGSSVGAAAWIREAGWPNPGGDRTWIAPELEFFIGDPARVAETYRVPPELDPGTWRMAKVTSDEIQLAMETDLPLRQRQGQVRVRLTKTLRPAAHPLRDVAPLCSEARYAGYVQSTTLQVESGPPDIKIGLWNLLQLPSPGAMTVATHTVTTPRIIFGKIPTADLHVASHQIRWLMGRRTTDAKISVKAAPLTGRAGYAWRSPQEDIWNLVIRQFLVEPSGEYVDVPWDEATDSGYAFQACAVCSGAERFNELEYHASAVCAADRNHSEDRSHVWAFRGSREALAAISMILLGVENVLKEISCRVALDS